MIPQHPWWYYKYYDLLFSRGINYSAESLLISKGITLHNNFVKEIGAGLGGHSDYFLENIEQLYLFDTDIEATLYLRIKYRNITNVIVCLSDGFSDNSLNKYNLVFCMYSVLLLGVEELSALIERFHSVYRSLVPGGRFVFEIVDIEINKLLHPHNHTHLLFNNNYGNVFVKTLYEFGRYSIVYSGMIEGKPLIYSVSYIDTTITSVVDAIKSELGITIYTKQIDNSKRRMLGYFEKPI